MTVKIEQALIRAIKKHGEETYPHECCGFLLGKALDGSKQVVSALKAANSRETRARRNRFLIAPDEYLRAEKVAREQALDVIGFYHSHPEVEAQPSQYDIEHAWPWYSYLIVSVKGRRADKVTSWVLEDDRSQFCEETLIIKTVRNAGGKAQ